LARSENALTTEAILGEAAKLFAERGYSNTRMQDIAKRFGVTHAALYYHFRNKQDILAQMNWKALNGLLEELADVESDTNIPADEKFDVAFERHVLYVAENILTVRSLFDGEYALPPECLERLGTLRREYNDRLQELFVVAQTAGRFMEMDARVAVNLLLGAGTWIYRWYKPERNLPPEVLASTALQLLGRGFVSSSDLSGDA
jgi:TetR/AcrR family transcriptional regulator, cholesterol catabolism regulator